VLFNQERSNNTKEANIIMFNYSVPMAGANTSALERIVTSEKKEKTLVLH
jgi:hypothetical protein